MENNENNNNENNTNETKIFREKSILMSIRNVS